jgi:4-hydroxy-4-methyl-2-oxoglutarate aldolase
MTDCDELLKRLKHLPTTALSDALDVLGLPGALEGIVPLSTDYRVVGPAFTVQYAPIDTDGGTVGDFLDDVPAGAVVVIDNAARTDVTVWGGIMTQVATVRGVGGTVINGVCRDVTTSLSQNYPLFSRGRFMRTGKDRVRLAAVGEAVTIAGVRIAPGDIICADADGAVSVQESKALQVAEIAEQIERVESDIVSAVQAGSTLRQARTDFAYHELQRRRA